MPTLSIVLVVMTACLLSACARPGELPLSGSLAQPRDTLDPPAAIAYATPPLGTEHTPVADRQANAERDASDVLRAMNRDLLACFARGGTQTEAHIMAEIVVGHDGGVRNVSTTGGADVRPAARLCFERRLARAKFMPPYAEGTARLTVPFSFVLESR